MRGCDSTQILPDSWQTGVNALLFCNNNNTNMPTTFFPTVVEQSQQLSVSGQDLPHYYVIYNHNYLEQVI